jgi:hypothetical protein
MEQQRSKKKTEEIVKDNSEESKNAKRFKDSGK